MRGGDYLRGPLLGWGANPACEEDVERFFAQRGCAREEIG
jgi:hypothetical protein